LRQEQPAILGGLALFLDFGARVFFGFAFGSCFEDFAAFMVSVPL
jgi:hypothetical protein